MLFHAKTIPLTGSQESVGSLNPRIFSDLDEFILYNNVDIANDIHLCLICVIELKRNL